MERRSLILELATLLIFLLLAVIVVHFSWFEGKTSIIVNPSDFDFPISPINDLYKALFSWQSKDLGNYFYGFAETFLRLGIATLYLLCRSNIALVQQILFILILYIMFLSEYLALRTVISRLMSFRNIKNQSKAFLIFSSVIAGNFYMFHMSTMLKYNSGYIFSFIVHAMYPLIFLSSLNYILYGKKGDAVLSVLFSLMAFTSHPAYVLLILSVPILAFPVATILKGESHRNYVQSYIIRAFLCILFLLIFTSVYWLPMLISLISSSEVKAQLGDITSILSMTKSVDSFADLFRYLGCPPFRWTFKGDPYYPYASLYYTPPFVFLGFFIAIISFSGLLLRRNVSAKLRRVTLLFALYTLFAMFLMKGTSEPLAEINSWLYVNLPIFRVFCEPYDKFGLLYAFFSSTLLGLSLYSFSLRCVRNDTGGCRIRFSKSLIYAFFIIVIIIVNIYSWPFLTGDIFPRYSSESRLKPARINLPSYYEKVADYINSQPYEFRVLGLPSSSSSTPSGWVPYTWGYNGVDPLYHYLSKSYLTENPWKSGISQILYALTSEKNLIERFLPLSAYLNIKYILVRKDIDYKFYPALPPEDVSRELSAHGLVLEKVFGKIEVYTVPDKYFLPHIYSTTNLVLVEGNVSDMLNVMDSVPTSNYAFVPSSMMSEKQHHFFRTQVYSIIVDNEIVKNNLTKLTKDKFLPSVTFKKINPTKFVVEVENATQPFFLLFSESYDPQWKIYIEDKPTTFNQVIAEYPRINVKEAKHDWYKFTPEDIVFLFKKPAVNETLHFIVNGYANAWYIDPKEIDKDGDGSFTITLYYLPQSLFYLGLVISIITFIVCISYLIHDWKLRKK